MKHSLISYNNNNNNNTQSWLMYMPVDTSVLYSIGMIATTRSFYRIL